MKVLIFGGSGMLGHKLVWKFKEKFDVSATFHGEFNKYSGLEKFDGVKVIENVNAENEDSANKTVKKIRPDVIVNAIGVIKQLPDAKNTIKTLKINAIFPQALAQIAAEQSIRLITISTDCVFSGKKGDYTEEDSADALDLYGRSKNLGEVVSENCLTLRTSIIGRELFTNHSLVEWFLSNRGKKIKGFGKAIYTGFPTVILSEILMDIIINHPNLSGLYHVASDKINKFELLELINREFRVNAEIELFENFVIDRSLDSRKFRAATGFEPQNWKEMIKIMAVDGKDYDNWRK